jgi:cystathionine beta-lyase/cystathionine gamma-synthase
LPVIESYDPAIEGNPKLPWNMVRFYIGLKDEKILLKDINQALSQSEI